MMIGHRAAIRRSDKTLCLVRLYMEFPSPNGSDRFNGALIETRPMLTRHVPRSFVGPRELGWLLLLEYSSRALLEAHSLALPDYPPLLLPSFNQR